MPRPVLMFHSVAADVTEQDVSYNISPARFWRAIDLIRYFGFSPVTTVEDRTHNRREVVMTFDDGYKDLYSEVFPRFLELGIRAVAFVVVDRLSQTMDWNPAIRKQLMTASQMQEMHRHGFRFGSHTLTHRDLTASAPDIVRKEIFESKARLEDLLGDAVDAFSYPWGLVNPLARAMVAEAGYKCAVTTVSRLSTLKDDPLLIPRLTVSEQDTAMSLATKLWTGINYSNVTPSRVLQWYMRRRSAAARG